MKHVVSIDTLDLVVDRGTVPDLRCPVCMSLLRAPVVQCRNGHLFCDDCVRGVANCPECRVRISGDALARALFVERQIKGLRVHCLYRYPEKQAAEQDDWVADSDGCTAVVALADQEAHHVTCTYRFVSCPFCMQRFRFLHLADHKKACSKRIVDCEHCKLRVRFDVMAAHLDTCSGFPIRCEVCGANDIARDSLSSHVAKECPETLVPCPFQSHGCAAEPMQRKRVEGHLRDEAFKHMALMQERLDEQARLLKQALLVRDLRIATLEDQMAQIRATKMKNTVIWEVHNWEGIVKQGKKFLRSKTFQGSNGFDFFFGLFPFGEGHPAPNKMTCCLFLDVDRKPPENARITVDFSVSVVNWLYEPMTVSHYHENVQFPLVDYLGGGAGGSGGGGGGSGGGNSGGGNSVSNAGWGPEDGLIKTDYLTRDSGFLSNDGLGTLTINATFRVVNIAYQL